jgi:hypothetical protein
MPSYDRTGGLELHEEEDALQNELKSLEQERWRERARLRGGADSLKTKRTPERSVDSTRAREKEAQVRSAREAIARRATIRKLWAIGAVVAVILGLALAVKARVGDKGRNKKDEDLPGTYASRPFNEDGKNKPFT